MPKKLFIIHEIIYFSKKLLFFQIRDFKSKITRKCSFEIHNLEGNRKCTIRISVSIWHIFKQMKKKIAKLLFSLNKTFKSSI